MAVRRRWRVKNRRDGCFGKGWLCGGWGSGNGHFVCKTGLDSRTRLRGQRAIILRVKNYIIHARGERTFGARLFSRNIRITYPPDENRTFTPSPVGRRVTRLCRWISRSRQFRRRHFFTVRYSVNSLRRRRRYITLLYDCRNEYSRYAFVTICRNIIFFNLTNAAHIAFFLKLIYCLTCSQVTIVNEFQKKFYIITSQLLGYTYCVLVRFNIFDCWLCFDICVCSGMRNILKIKKCVGISPMAIQTKTKLIYIRYLPYR